VEVPTFVRVRLTPAHEKAQYRMYFLCPLLSYSSSIGSFYFRSVGGFYFLQSFSDKHAKLYFI